MILRSMMFVPGHNERLIEKALKSSADALILDLEDSVRPEINKDIARHVLAEMGKNGRFDGHRIFIRVNDFASGRLNKDVGMLSSGWVTGFVQPKVYSGADIVVFDHLLSLTETGGELGRLKVIPLIETASAVLHVKEICEASQRVVAVAFGCEDFITDIKGVSSSETLMVPRAMIAMGARATGKIPIDTVHIDVNNLIDLERNARQARNLGFEGQLVLHPKELDIVNDMYSPSYTDYLDAKEMLELSKLAAEEGKGVAVIDGKFIGPPLVKAAHAVIARYEEIEKWESRLEK